MKKQIINKYLGKFGVELHGKGYLQSLANGEFKKDAFAVQKEWAGHSNIVVFDVGANRGDVSAEYRQHFPSAEIFAFEPFPGSFEIFRSKHAGDARIHGFQLALAGEKGEKTLYVNESVDTNSLLPSKVTGLSSDKHVKNISSIPVETTTMDIFCGEKGIGKIDILKMDIQGGEWAALNGAANLLKNGNIGLIYSEVFFLEQYERQPLFHDISKLLHGYGYHLQDIYNPYYGKGSMAWSDAIFVRR
ncbi:MAG TPA: FkbM family methyltransferase [Puia sp.]|jgi:FkbM family methyltransferase|nr:FkbM family methyltransferase [Puia sp.]